MLGFIGPFVLSLLAQLPSLNLSKETQDVVLDLALALSPTNCMSQGLNNYLQCKAFGLDEWAFETHQYGAAAPTIRFFCGSPLI
jgi:hypothetical protein